MIQKAENDQRAQPERYISRIDFLRERCRGKTVLSLGCSSGRFIEDHLRSNTHLHNILHEVSSDLYGVDLDEESLVLMRERLGFKNLYPGNVEHLENVPIQKKFDIVVAGDLLEHITCPGAMLNGIKRFLHERGELIISTNNAFGLHYQIKRWLGRYREHFEHVAFFSPETLLHLFERHGYRVDRIYGAYTRPPHTFRQRVLFTFGSPLFRMAPVLAGTLVVVAKPA
jgi:2-polyprenyl-3-methyl-5-hydroxy-6-metoxy-1,4-benzoquinol methylase